MPVLVSLFSPFQGLTLIFDMALIFVAHLLTWRELFQIIFVPGLLNMGFTVPRMLAIYHVVFGQIDIWILPFIFWIFYAGFSFLIYCGVFLAVFMANRFLVPKRFKERINRLGV